MNEEPLRRLVGTFRDLGERYSQRASETSIDRNQEYFAGLSKAYTDASKELESVLNGGYWFEPHMNESSETASQ